MLLVWTSKTYLLVLTPQDSVIVFELGRVWVKHFISFICVINDHRYVPLVINTFLSFPHSWPITGFLTRVKRRVPLVEQELLTLPEHLSSLPVKIYKSFHEKLFFFSHVCECGWQPFCDWQSEIDIQLRWNWWPSGKLCY